ncbi:molybdate ABC transporter substrate-binding protein [Motilimonas cestriensis]|uniref:molybdate ABC transporter substrate-binding protein n=1 Tax=Motilimonas cestriensis TaxID=2742685 RepID=UPI003DA563F9
MLKRVLATLLATCCSINIAQANEVRVLVASSLQPAMQQLLQAYQSTHNDVNITLVTGASSALARQIEQGAPVDIYVSANQKWMDYLQQQPRVVIHQNRLLLSNQLVLVSKKAQPGFNLTQLQSWQNVLAGQRLAVADPQHVPAGMYAQQAMTTLDLWSELKAQMAFSHNVRATLALVERGAAALGVVYASDAFTSKQVVTVAKFSDASHSPIVYPAGLLSEQSSAHAFYDYLWSEQARNTWQAFGFVNLKQNVN